MIMREKKVEFDNVGRSLVGKFMKKRIGSCMKPESFYLAEK